ncbi:adenine phosphoribosyltransferase [candidate division KSB1 bacterium]|nr:adenine phosphoribosyltransferase [candidate division KSB1 bacterium]
MTTLSAPTTTSLLEEASKRFEPVPDFPVPGIMFRDISPLLMSQPHFHATISALTHKASRKPFAEADTILAIDARGFLFASPLALNLKQGLVMVRKAGKLPNSDMRGDQKTEYGADVLTFQSRFVTGKRFFVVDDVVATGGTIDSVMQMAKDCGGHYLGTLSVLDLRYCRTDDRPDIASVFHMDHPAGPVNLTRD